MPRPDEFEWRLEDSSGGTTPYALVFLLIAFMLLTAIAIFIDSKFGEKYPGTLVGPGCLYFFLFSPLLFWLTFFALPDLINWLFT